MTPHRILKIYFFLILKMRRIFQVDYDFCPHPCPEVKTKAGMLIHRHDNSVPSTFRK